jgi:hypothetical protein
MSSSSTSTSGQPFNRSQTRCCGGWGNGANWSGINIAAMVVGFVLFWPVGLFVLYWIATGRDVGDLPQWIHQHWSRVTGMCKGKEGFSKDPRNDNVVFNEFQQTQYDRIREIKEEIKGRARRFAEFRANAKRRADKEEFNQFMADAPGSGEA